MTPVTATLFAATFFATAALPWHAAHRAAQAAAGLCVTGWHAAAHTCASLGAAAADNPHMVCGLALYGALAFHHGHHAHAEHRAGNASAAREKIVESAVYTALALASLL